jgi:VCBS repeat-containing protein
MRRRWTLEELDGRIVPTFLGNQLFPLDNPWNQVVAGAPVAANSGAIINAIVTRHLGTAPRVHADFGSPLDLNLYGIPVNIANSSTPRYDIYFPADGYVDESDVVQVPIPDNAVIEGDNYNGPATPAARGDSHLLVYDQSANVLYELFQAVRPNEHTFPYGGAKPNNQWGAYQISVWDLNANSFRTIGATSADAAGLPILPGLLRPDDVYPSLQKPVPVIDHAIRMTVVRTRDSFVFPASHEASSYTDANLPRMGERFRLKSDFVIPAGWSPQAKAITQAMKTYGLIVADNGSDFYFQGTPDPLWQMDSVLDVQALRATDFEVVDLTPRVTSLSVTSGSTAGGRAVTITGNNFGGAAGQLHVLFGGVEAASVTILSNTQLVAVAPTHAAGTVDVRVQSGTDRLNTDGQTEFFGYGTSPVSTATKFAFGTPPVATGDAYAVVHDRTMTIVAAAGVLGNDASIPAGHTLTAAVATGPAHGTVTLNANGSFTYKPAAGYVGPDSFTYTAKDGLFTSDPATVTLDVTDQLPVAGNDSYKTGKGRALTVAAAGLLANDTDADGDARTAAVATGPAHGTLTLNANGSFTYTPAAGYVGADSFTYVANDKARDSAPATVTLAVAAPPQVKSVVINDGSAQRSLIRSITVMFDTLVTFDAGAIRVVRAGGIVPTLTRTVTQANGETTVVLTFSGTGTYARSLIDGNWTLRVVKSRVHRADFRPATMEADSLTSFYRLYGDVDGNRTVDAADQLAFDAAFGQTDALSLAAFDFNRDGQVNATDRTQFTRRLGRTV